AGGQQQRTQTETRFGRKTHARTPSCHAKRALACALPYLDFGRRKVAVTVYGHFPGSAGGWGLLFAAPAFGSGSRACASSRASVSSCVVWISCFNSGSFAASRRSRLSQMRFKS